MPLLDSVGAWKWNSLLSARAQCAITSTVLKSCFFLSTYIIVKKLINARDKPTMDSKSLKSNGSPSSKENCSSRYASDVEL